MSTLVERMIRAAKLDVTLYEEVEADPDATRQAIFVVVLASVAGGLGMGGQGLGGILVGVVLTLLGLALWVFLTYWIGTTLLPEPQTRASFGEVLRTVGFANSPGVLRLLGVIPGLRWLLLLVTGIWVLVATVIAVRQALDYRSTPRAVGVCLAGWLIQMILAGVAFALLGSPGRPDF